MNKCQLRQHRQGFTLLIAILVIGIVLAIGLSILNITLKEFILSGIARESAIALGAADAGMECALYWDRSSDGNKFDPAPNSALPITCMGTSSTWQGAPATVGGVMSGASQNIEFSWGTPQVCAKVTVVKYFTASAPAIDMGGGSTCPIGVECTRVVSLGYNRACGEIGDDPRTVERGLRARY